MAPKLLNDGYKPAQRVWATPPSRIENGYQPSKAPHSPPPSPPKNTGSSVVKPKD